MCIRDRDGGIPIGVNRNAVKDLKKNFVNQLNNPNKMSPTLYLSIEEFEYEGMLLLYTYVPPTSTVEKCSGRVYDLSLIHILKMRAKNITISYLLILAFINFPNINGAL